MLLYKGVDITAATKHGIKVAKIPGGATGNAASCAEMAIYLILGLLRKQHQMKISVEQKKLGEPTGVNLQGKTVSFTFISSYLSVISFWSAKMYLLSLFHFTTGWFLLYCCKISSA